MLKKVLALLLVVVMTSSMAFAQQAECRQSERIGEGMADEEHRSGGWFWGSFAGNLFFGLLGSGVVVGFAAFGDAPEPDTYPEDAPLRDCYEDGYGERAQQMNTRSAIWGGVAGWGTRVVVGTVVYVAYLVVYGAALFSLYEDY